jgi:hypothetical protein
LPVPESTREQSQQLAPPYEDIPSQQGFSIAVLGLDEANGGLVPTVATTYHRGCKLYIKLRGLNRFTGFYIGAVSAQGSYGDGQMSEHSGTRYGAFFRTAVTAASAAAASGHSTSVSGSGSGSGSGSKNAQQHVSAVEALVLSKDRHVASAKDMCTDEVSWFYCHTCVTVTDCNRHETVAASGAI